VVEIPTNVLCIRNDEDDEVYRTARKVRSGPALIRGSSKTGQPVLVGTTSIEKRRDHQHILRRKRVPHAC